MTENHKLILLVVMLVASLGLFVAAMVVLMYSKQKLLDAMEKYEEACQIREEVNRKLKERVPILSTIDVRSFQECEDSHAYLEAVNKVIDSFPANLEPRFLDGGRDVVPPPPKEPTPPPTRYGHEGEIPQPFEVKK